MRRFVMILIAFLLVYSLVAIDSVYAKWAYPFVVNDGKTYEVSDQHIEPEHIGTRIGKVTFYSDQEGTYSGNFSNHYPKGTEYYEIKGVDVLKAIAIKGSDGSFIQANNKGEYAGSTGNWPNILYYILGGIPLIIVILIVMRRRSSHESKPK